MTAADIRQSFLDFFKEKEHTIVPSASLLPQSLGLLFTNAGMNQFVPYFLGTEKAPYNPPRAADTQKCIRAGGKHNDLEDVGYDTYHHTLFEMLGNWSFGNYFKAEAIAWAWELVVERWGLPANRLYATVYAPEEGDPSEFDQEAWDLWAALFEKAGLDPKVHIVNGNVKDNFWMMGETGPCGPCSELHVDMTPKGDTGGKLVNMDSDLCIEIWNLVFIQYDARAANAEEEEKRRTIKRAKPGVDWERVFVPLPATHVDTGMGFERVCSLIQNTKGFTDFSEKPTNYNTDVFQPIFRKLEELSGKKYVDVYPMAETSGLPAQESNTLEEAIAFRVIADHIRTLSFSIADGIIPGNTGRNYVLRRILRRAVKYGRTLGFTGDKPFLPELVDTLITEFGEVFPEIKTRVDVVKDTLATEENSFNKTLDRGLKLFYGSVCWGAVIKKLHENGYLVMGTSEAFFSEQDFNKDEISMGKMRIFGKQTKDQVFEGSWNEILHGKWKTFSNTPPSIDPEDAFKLYDTYGFPVDLTRLLATELGFTLDEAAVEKLMEEARELSRSAQKKTIVRATDISTDAVTEFLGFDQDSCEATILEIHEQDNALLVITDRTVFFTEMGGQEGDTGMAETSGLQANIEGTQKIGGAVAHLISADSELAGRLEVSATLTLTLDRARRAPIEAHHTATHLLHWALHEVVSPDAAQQGSSVSPDRLRFDFNSKAVTDEQIAALEEKVNTSIQSGDLVSWIEVPHEDVKNRDDIMQFFGDKYGDLVRVVQIGGGDKTLDGYSMELCGGTHVTNTRDIGLFKIKSEGAIASGVRRIEAVCGDSAWNYIREIAEKGAAEEETLRAKLDAANAKLTEAGQDTVEHVEFPRIMAALLSEGGDFNQINATVKSYQDHLVSLREAGVEAEKKVKKAQAAGAARLADSLLSECNLTGNIVLSTEGPAALLQELLNGLKKVHFTHAAFFIVDDGDKLHLGALCGEDGNNAGHGAGNLIKDLAPIAGGKGGGKPDMARGAAGERDKAAELKSAAEEKLQ